MVYSSEFYTNQDYKDGYRDAIAVEIQFQFGRKDHKRYHNNDMYRKGYDQGEADAKSNK